MFVSIPNFHMILRFEKHPKPSCLALWQNPDIGLCFKVSAFHLSSSAFFNVFDFHTEQFSSFLFPFPLSFMYNSKKETRHKLGIDTI